MESLLKLAVETGASDLHLTVGSLPVLRLDGRLTPLDDPALGAAGVMPDLTHSLTPEDTEDLARQVMDERQRREFSARGEIDFSFSLPGKGRFRVNAYRQRGSVAMAIRPVKMEIPSVAELGLPSVVTQLALLQRGLVLVTGPTGSGKSTTLAAMIDLLNSERRLHIITIEDPIEYIHRHRRCLINQREIGLDSESFASALRAAMREDPDVILVGEMRDLETISTAITAAETGHLVLATLHTLNAVQTIDRIVDVFPPHQQQQIRYQLALVLQGVISQQLIPRQDSRGRVPAVEVMIVTPAIRNLIRENKTHQIASHIQTGARSGMQTMESSLAHLYRQGLISLQEALDRAPDPETLRRLLNM